MFVSPAKTVFCLVEACFSPLLTDDLDQISGSTAALLHSMQDNKLLMLQLGLLLTATSANCPSCHQKPRQRGISLVWWPLAPDWCQRSTRQCRGTQYCPHVPLHHCQVRHYFNTVSPMAHCRTGYHFLGWFFITQQVRQAPSSQNGGEKVQLETNLL